MPADNGLSTIHDNPTLRVAIIVPILNEGKTLPRLLTSIASQDYPLALLEVIIVDGGSSDDWEECLRAVPIPEARITILSNPKRVVPAAVNQAIRSTDAPAVLWISGHCILAPDYVSSLAREFMRRDNVAVGGRLLVEGEGISGRLNAMVLMSPIGTGLAPWRWNDRPGWARSVNFAMFSRETLLAMGGLDERLVRNQDNDLIRRLRDRGVRFYQVASTVTYLAPQSLSGLWRRAWGNASWTVWSWKLGVPSAQWYHLAPMVALLIGGLLCVGSVVSSTSAYILIGLIGSYAILLFGHTILVAVRGGPLWTIPILPIHLAIFHTTYGLGGWVALIRPVPQQYASRT
ncbi:MAG: glycosyltransferase family 2 protein [Candidatus Zixiibacteriota bacterium]